MLLREVAGPTTEVPERTPGGTVGCLALPVPHKGSAELWSADSLRCPDGDSESGSAEPSGRFCTLAGFAGERDLRSPQRGCGSRSVRVSGQAWQPATRELPEALSALEAAGRISLPSPTHSGGGTRRPRRLASPVLPPKSVPEEVGAVEGLKLTLITDDEHRLLWNTMREEEHPHGAGPLVDCQLRCGGGAWLDRSRRVRGLGVQARTPRPSAGMTQEGAPICTGWLACAAFWPGVECRISHVLGGVVRRLGRAISRNAMVTARLETFVDRHAGRSFRAAS